jgi:phytanoyl-CoA hydroxylase
MEQTRERVAFDNYVDDGGYTADMYEYHEIDEGIESLDAATDADVDFFHRNGYLAVRNAFTCAEVDDMQNGLMDLIKGKNPEFKGVQFEISYKDRLHTLTDDERWDAVRKLQYFMGYDHRLTRLAEHPKILDIMARIIGEEPALYSHQAILKPPLVGREKPWHQDHAYFNLPMSTTIVSMWISLDKATPENGCMRVIPGTHLQGPRVHFKRRDWQICDTHVVRNHVVAVPLEPGGCLIWSGMIHHGTPANTTPHRRRALQFHYFPARVKETTSQERLAVFGSEGKDVTC